MINSPTVFPWSSIAKVKIGPSGGGRGTAFLVAPCTLLTNGHVAWNRPDNDCRTLPGVYPGSYYSETLGRTVDPFGEGTVYSCATNTKYHDTGKWKYDYAAIFLWDDFEDAGLNTYMPLKFNYNPSYINLSGYPSEDLPSSRTGATREQWFGHGDKKSKTTRKLKYEASSTGGASGSPVWVYYSSSNERYAVAINQGHTNSDNDGRGVRLVDKNKSLIRGWMDFECPGDIQGHGFTERRRIDFDDLLVTRTDLTGQPIKIFDPGHFNLVPAPLGARFRPATSEVMQYIEGTLYHWEEVALEDEAEGTDLEGEILGRATPPRRFLRMVSPERRLLDPEEAAVLLSASQLWMRPVEQNLSLDGDQALPRFVPQAPSSFGPDVQDPDSIDEGLMGGRDNPPL
ncbi:MAG: trypsin-like serine peptidase [Bradymonadia bacterium]